MLSMSTAAMNTCSNSIIPGEPTTMRRTLGLALALALSTAACDDLQDVTRPDADLLNQASQLGDATNLQSGVRGIYFFPPLAETPLIPEGDVANAGLAPVLIACAVIRWDPSDGSHPDDSNSDGYADELKGLAACDETVVGVGETSDPSYDPESELYQGAWRAPEPEEEEPFRLLVQVHSATQDADVVLGWVDAWIGDTGGGSTSNSADGYVRLNRGSNNPVKFYVGLESICGIDGLVDCVVGILGSNQNQNPGITTPEKKANVIVCEDAGADDCTEETLSNGQGVPFLAYRDESRLNDFGLCIPGLTLPQYAAVSTATEDGYGCYFFQAFKYDGTVLDYGFPAGTRGFSSMCLPFDAIPDDVPLDQVILIKEDKDGNVVRLPRVIPPAAYTALLEQEDPCGEYSTPHHTFESRFENPLLRLADRGLNAVASSLWGLVEPEPLYAYFFLHQGVGGELRGFSHVVPTIDARYDAQSPSDATAILSQPVANVPVTSVYYEGAATDVGIEGVEVVYAFESYTGPTSADFEICADQVGCVTEADLPDDASLAVLSLGTGLAALSSLQFNSTGTYVISASVLGACPVGEPDCDGNSKIYYTFTVCGVGSGLGTATVDGEVTSAGEWACAAGMAFDANVSGGSAPAEWWFMSDATNLYMLLRVEREPDDKVNRLRVDFDADGTEPFRSALDNIVQMDGTQPAGSQFADWYLTSKCVKSSQSNCGEPDAPADLDGTGVFGEYASTTPYFIYEFSFPLDSPDDWGTDPEAIRAFITLAQGSGAQGNTQIPAFKDYRCVVWTVDGSGIGCGPDYPTPTNWPLPSGSN
jgi:hypothetical protein